jgi:hypothetical protein
MTTAAPALDYAGRCARYLPQRGIPYDPERLSVGRLTPRQRKRALKKERRAWPLLPDIDGDPYDGDDDDPRCTICGGEVWVECDDPIQCCTPGCDGEMHPDPACGGTGLYVHQVIF